MYVKSLEYFNTAIAIDKENLFTFYILLFTWDCKV